MKRKVKVGMLVILGLGLIGIGIQGAICYCSYHEHQRLLELKGEYEYLIEEIDSYTELKNHYLVMLEEEKGLLEEKSGLQGKVNQLNEEIQNLQNQISEIEKKINNIS